MKTLELVLGQVRLIREHVGEADPAVIGALLDGVIETLRQAQTGNAARCRRYRERQACRNHVETMSDSVSQTMSNHVERVSAGPFAPLDGPPPLAERVSPAPLPKDSIPPPFNPPTSMTPFFQVPLADSAGESVASSAEPELDLEPAEAVHAKRSKSGKRASGGSQGATRLPLDWQPDFADYEFAQKLGLDPGNIADEFCDYWRAAAGQNARKHDWQACWRNWCRRSAGQQQHGWRARETPGERRAREGREATWRWVAAEEARRAAAGVDESDWSNA